MHPLPINDQILALLAEHSFEFELDNHGQIVVYTNLKLVEDANAPSGCNAVLMTDADYGIED